VNEGRSSSQPGLEGVTSAHSSEAATGSTDKLRYSDRQRLAETGTLGDLSWDEVPRTLRVAISALVESASEPAAPMFVKTFGDQLMQHFGIGQMWSTYVGNLKGVGFVDLLEILAETGTRSYFVRDDDDRRPRPRQAFGDDFEDQINRILTRHRFGYRLESGEAHRIGSPALDDRVVGPALLAIQREGWEEVDRTYREALQHQRAGEIDDALTSASAAVESALKAVGMKGTTLGALARSFRGSQIVQGYVSGVPELLVDLINRLEAVRSTEGDAHGKAPGAEAAPQELSDLAVYWAGAFIAYLAQATAA
jgi:hypothetical protein